MKYEAPSMEFVSFCKEDVLAESTESPISNSLKIDIFEDLI